jgi:phage/plasmid-like protein (TIGR03299 family)
MAHHVETMFSVRETPWHKLGTVLTDAPRTTADALRAAGLDWAVAKRPISLMDSARPIDSHVATVRQTDGAVLGVVGAGWTPVQNQQAFDWFEPLIAEGRGSFETAGSLRDGRVVWVLARLAESFEVVPGDAVRGFLLLSNSHDGSRAVEARFTPIRVVCANTLAMADRGRETDRPIKIRHTRGVHAALDEAARVMGVVAQQLADTTEAYRLIASVQLNATKVDAFLRAVVPDNAKAASPKRTAAIRAEIQDLLDGKGVGLDLPGVRGTAWAAYNAVTEFVDYARGMGEGRPLDDTRLESIAFGSGAQMKRRALEAALALV